MVKLKQIMKGFLKKEKEPIPVAEALDIDLKKRKSHRHLTKDIVEIHLLIGTEVFPLQNISRGGTCFKSNDERFSVAFLERKTLEGQLFVIGQQCAVQFQFTYVQGDLIGVSFMQDKAVDKFLDSVIYFMEGGLSLTTLPKQQVSSYFQGPYWNAYQALNGVIEVYVGLNHGGGLEKMSIVYYNGKLKEITGFSPKAISVSVENKSDIPLPEKKRILRNTVLIILGFKQIGKSTLFDHVLTAAINRITN